MFNLSKSTNAGSILRSCIRLFLLASDPLSRRERGKCAAIFTLFTLLSIAPLTHAGDLTISLPAKTEIQSALARPKPIGDSPKAEIKANEATFKNLLPETPHDLTLTLKDKTILQGVDLGWYSLEEPKENPQPMDDDDREQIRAIVQDIPSFYNKRNVILTKGDHDRAVYLVELLRDTAFHSDKGGEIVWHIELWYFKNQNGGWEKVQQQDKVLRRERFKSRDAYDKVMKPIRWIPEFGGVVMKKDEKEKSIKLTSEQLSERKDSSQGTPP